MSARILDPKFKYVNAAKTNIRLTFAKLRREQREAEARNIVVPIKAKKAGTK